MLTYELLVQLDPPANIVDVTSTRSTVTGTPISKLIQLGESTILAVRVSQAKNIGVSIVFNAESALEKV